MPGEDRHSKSEKPTAKRKKDARREGTVARTPEVVTWIVVLVGTYLVQYTFTTTYTLIVRLWAEIANGMTNPSVATDLTIAGKGVSGALIAVAPALLASAGMALAVNLAQTRGLVTLHPLKPTLSRISPKTGLKRLFSVQSVWNVTKQLVRVALLGFVAWQSVYGLLPFVAGSGPLSSFAIASLVAGRALTLAREVAAIGLVLSVADYIVQYRKVATQLRMTKHEVKEEAKASDGNPYIKGQIRRRMRQMARNRMIAAVAGADAVVVNPTHFAVALRYVRGQGAPKVVAKGADFLALRIREEAMTWKVPVVEDPPLARALYVACDLEQEIPKELYEAVARLLTFIYGLKASGRIARIDGAPLRPGAPLLTGAPARVGGTDGEGDEGGDEGGDEEAVGGPRRRAVGRGAGGGGGGSGPVSAIGALI
jgi:flagellar biosynthetic protein FlhB